jgi:hypothetical protein
VLDAGHQRWVIQNAVTIINAQSHGMTTKTSLHFPMLPSSTFRERFNKQMSSQISSARAICVRREDDGFAGSFQFQNDISIVQHSQDQARSSVRPESADQGRRNTAVMN